jgi:hypothetical protein
VRRLFYEFQMKIVTVLSVQKEFSSVLEAVQLEVVLR